MSGFSILSLIGKDEKASGDFVIEQIPLDKIIPSKENFYDVSEIEELKESLRLFGEVQNSLVCNIEGTDTYRLIAGHRRRLAHMALAEEGLSGYNTMPCLVRAGDPDTGDIESRLMLILTNATARELKDWEKAKQAAELKKLLLAYKAAGHKISGSLRQYIAETLGISETQAQRLESINNNLSPEFQEAFKTEFINVSVAAELAVLTPDEQKDAFAVYKERGELSVREARDLRAEALAGREAREKQAKQQERQETEQTEPEEQMEMVDVDQTTTWETVLAPHRPEKPKMVQNTVHQLKCWPEYYQATEQGNKNFEYRRNDRDFKLGDFILLQEYDQMSGYTGREKQLMITYILSGHNLPENWVVLGTKVLN